MGELNKLMKSEKAVTLTALVIYIIVFVMILTIMTTLTGNFLKNMDKIKESPKYISEFNKFSMFFIADVKRNPDVSSLTKTTIEFMDGTTYRYENKTIYRNDQKIAGDVKSLAFTKSDYTVNSVTKKIINVDTTLGSGNEEMNRNIDFVLKYW